MERRIEGERGNVLPREEVFSILVTLYDQTNDTTRTRFKLSTGEEGVGVEDGHRDVKVKGKTRIPNGTYNLDLRYSPKFSSNYFRDDEGNIIHRSKRIDSLKEQYHIEHELIWVKDVPNFEYILIHWGNTHEDTDGCYIVGTAFATIDGVPAVTASRKKYEEIYPVIWRAIKSGRAIINYNR